MTNLVVETNKNSKTKANSMAEVKEWLAANAVTTQYDEVSG